MTFRKTSIIAGCFAAIVLSSVLVVFVWGDRLVLEAARYALQKALPRFEISLQSAKLHPGSLVLRNVQAKHTSIILETAETDIDFNLPDLIGGKISKITVKNTVVRARGSATQILSTVSSVTSPAKASDFFPRPTVVEITALALDLQSDVMSLKGSLSLSLRPRENKVASLEAQIVSAEINGLSVKNWNVSFDEKSGGQLSAESIRYKKLTVLTIQSPFSLDGHILKVGPIQGTVLEGAIAGDFEIRMDGDKPYRLTLALRELSLPALMSDLEFEDKVSVTGKFLGEITVHGNRSGVDRIDGALSGSDGGGDLTILDEAFLGNIATRMNQPLELVKAGLKEYHYDSGQARLLKEGRDLGLDLSLDGPKGKRQLSTVFHDVI